MDFVQNIKGPPFAFHWILYGFVQNVTGPPFAFRWFLYGFYSERKGPPLCVSLNLYGNHKKIPKGESGDTKVKNNAQDHEIIDALRIIRII